MNLERIIRAKTAENELHEYSDFIESAFMNRKDKSILYHHKGEEMCDRFHLTNPQGWRLVEYHIHDRDKELAKEQLYVCDVIDNPRHAMDITQLYSLMQADIMERYFIEDKVTFNMLLSMNAPKYK